LVWLDLPRLKSIWAHHALSITHGQESRIYRYHTVIHWINVSLGNMEATNVLIWAQS